MNEAAEANSEENWNKLWSEEGDETWRKDAMNPIYVRISRLLGHSEDGQAIAELGGGRGILSKKLSDQGYIPWVYEHNDAAISACHDKGLYASKVDLVARPTDWACEPIVIATEVIEHFPEEVRAQILDRAQQFSEMAFFSVPNNRLGPDEEPQHTIKWTALEFKQYLEGFWGKGHVRVEVLGPYLLGVCTREAKGFTVSVCLPARDEAEDIATCLASYMGFCDQIVVGVDPRTTDATREIAAQYAEVVFDLEDPQGLTQPDPAPDGGVHFGWLRNQVSDRCTGDWIFMTEAHEPIISGQDTLLHLDVLVPAKANVGFVFRNGGHHGRRERWAFPWLYRNGVARWKRNTHNVLDYPDGTFCVRLPQINTLHERHSDREEARKGQRKVQNRKTLFDDWRVNENSNSLFYLAQELRGIDERNDERSIQRFYQFLASNNSNGEARYQSRLMLAKLHWKRDELKEAREVLMGATSDDWSRTEHWIWLGDLATAAGQHEQAHQFYMYAATRINYPPFTLWWIDLVMYSYLPAQRLAQNCAELGKIEEALHWATRVVELLPEDAPAGAHQEAQTNVTILKEALSHAG